MKPKNPSKLFPLFITDDLVKTKAFYVKHGFRAAIDMETYLQVSYDPGELELCFMKPDAMPDGKVWPKFAGQGVIVSVPTPDADAKYASMKRDGAELLSEPTDKPWGWRSFAALDPNGVVLDIFHVYKEMPAA